MCSQFANTGEKESRYDKIKDLIFLKLFKCQNLTLFFAKQIGTCYTYTGEGIWQKRKKRKKIMQENSNTV